MRKIRLKSKVELNYNQMIEVAEEILFYHDTTDRETDSYGRFYGDYGVYDYYINLDGDVILENVK